MTVSPATSGPANPPVPASDQPSAAATNAPANPPGRPVESFALAGVSNPPDPATHAYRKDLADTALTGRVIASHYADPLMRHLVADAPLLRSPEAGAEVIAALQAGDKLDMLDCSRGWAWGYGPDGRVGYVVADAVGI